MTNLLAAVIFSSALQAGAPAHAVATVGTRILDYETIRCRREKVAPGPLPAGANLDDLCRELEQRALDQWIIGIVLDVAAREYGLEPARSALEAQLPSRADTESAARRMDAIAHAALARMRGVPRASIEKQWLTPNGMAWAEFEAMAAVFTNPKVAEEYLAQNNVQDIRDSIIQQKRRLRMKCGAISFAVPEASK